MNDPGNLEPGDGAPPERAPIESGRSTPSILTIVLWIVLGVPLALVVLALLVLGVCFIGFGM